MLGLPIDAWYVWLGVALVSLAVLGVAGMAAPEPPSTADSAADTIEAVSAGSGPATGTHPIDADRVRLDDHRLVLDGEDAATLDHGRMTPAPRGTALRRVALGAAPQTVFASPKAFTAAVVDVRSAEHVIEPAGDELIVRSLSYGGTNVTLVTA